jgi:hypothetical protein
VAISPHHPLAGLHTPRLAARQVALETVFSAANMQEAWKSYVRPGLRDQEIIDLFDYNDFHWNKDARFEDLLSAIINGRYRPRSAIPAKLEKSLGVCRTIITPSPEDALVLQCIVERLLPNALAKQPSKNSFFSRSHQSFAGTFTFGRDYIWFRQWSRFAKRRLVIATAHKWIATTDISTFFDNINYAHLRNILSSLGEIDEVILDVLFSVIDNISWRPDYLPSSGVGIPQVQFDAPRLLAHAYLFEVDAYLKDQTGDTFVRWVDDITFAVDTRQQAKRLLRDLDVLLQMRGLRLNSGKTKILSAVEARRHFLQRENAFLDRIKIQIDRAIKSQKSTVSLSKRVERSFSKFVVRPPQGQSDKVKKRYIGLLSDLKSPFAIRECLSCFVSDPSIRDTAYRYFYALGPNIQVLRAFSDYLLSDDALDDASLCQISKLLTDWGPAPHTRLYREMILLMENVSDPTHIKGDPFRFLLSLWLVTKYSTQARLRKHLEDCEEIWMHSEFLSRQVAASGAKFRNPAHYEWLSERISRHGFRSALSVDSAIRTLKSFSGSIPSSIRLYILNGGNKGRYTIQRFLITVAVLSSPLLSNSVKIALKAAVLKVLSDEHYIRVVKAI